MPETHLEDQRALVCLQGQANPSLQVTQEVHAAPEAPGIPWVLGTYKHEVTGTEDCKGNGSVAGRTQTSTPAKCRAQRASASGAASRLFSVKLRGAAFV